MHPSRSGLFTPPLAMAEAAPAIASTHTYTKRVDHRVSCGGGRRRPSRRWNRRSPLRKRNSDRRSVRGRRVVRASVMPSGGEKSGKMTPCKDDMMPCGSTRRRTRMHLTSECRHGGPSSRKRRWPRAAGRRRRSATNNRVGAHSSANLLLRPLTMPHPRPSPFLFTLPPLCPSRLIPPSSSKLLMTPLLPLARWAPSLGPTAAASQRGGGKGRAGCIPSTAK
mmetsp:Transcript_1787/g.4959  ORF Transcript_1787/g.4959 Transcript_1787/m.4959 type:complete len:222 (+) Transcript_1787:224-889(+)